MMMLFDAKNVVVFWCESNQMARHFVMTADGGSRGNPGPAAFGTVIMENGNVVKEIAETIGIASNNVAEYRGLVAGLEAIHALDSAATIEVKMDSKLVVEQMSGRWQIKHPDMKELALRARNAHPHSLVTYMWIPREENAHADQILNSVLDGTPVPNQDPIQQNFLMERLISGESPTTILLVRHGETPLTPHRKFSGDGPLNPSLTEIGKEQAKKVATAIKKMKPDILIASPLARTQETAAFIANETGLDVVTDPIWIEQSFGLWDGMSVDEVKTQYPNEYKHWVASTSYKPPRGESYDEVRDRAIQALASVASDYTQKTVVVVTHNGVIKTAATAAINAPAESLFNIDISPCSISTIAIWPSDGLMALRGTNDRAHLR